MARKTKAEKQKQDHWQTYRAIGWAILAGLWLLLGIALYSHDPLDPPTHAYGVPNEQIQNWVGNVGALTSYHIYTMLGPGVWVGMAALAAFLFVTAIGREVTHVPVRALGVAVMVLATSALIGEGLPTLFANHLANPETAGGLVAMLMNDVLVARFALAGTILILAVAWWIGALMAADEWVLALPRAVGRMLLKAREVDLPKPAMSTAVSGAGSAVGGWLSNLSLPWRSSSDDADTATRRRPGRKRRRMEEDDETWIDEDAGGLGGTESFDPNEHQVSEEDEEEDDEEYEYEEEDADDADDDEEYEEEEEDDAADAPAAYLAEKSQFDPDALREKMKRLPINFAPRTSTKNAQEMREPDLTGYQFPGMDLLVEPETGFSAEMEAIVREQAMDLESALKEYKIDGEVVGIDSGPVITLFEVRLAPGTKVSQISAIDSDLARAMKAQNIRIVPNMAGKDTIGIEVPNLKKEKVRLKELMAAMPDAADKMKLPMFLGKDASGNPLISDLAASPHMLIAGTTGSGKSVCMNSIIMSFIYTRRPDELKLVLVDPKMVEMSQFKDIPHLMCPVVTEMAKAAQILEWAVTKMDERYELLAEAGVRDIGSYNGLEWEELKERMEPATEEEEARIPKKLPYMVFVIDELADLMMTNKEVESFIVRIAQKARAVGIHLILATQRPQANVVTGLIKSNLPCRIAMKVASGMDSRIVLDQKGGELLLGHGDMLFLSPRTSKLIRAQGTLVDDAEIRKAVKFLKEIANQHFEPQLVQIRSGDDASVDEEALKDPLFEKAVLVVLESKRGSVSLLQRRLTIGYGRASRLIEAMAAAGILGDHKGSQAREVTITLEEWEAMKAQAEADAAEADAEGTLYEESDEAAEEVDADAEEEFEYEEEEEDDEVPDEFDDEYKR
ncbi:DNA translocase FtsK 4TM domain-containing protein [Phycisphaerales bacterium AB-hyl4]|uniref:DNA translocase FtsK 4TM domain-containing protein n=1 Tax=Natronomicrosphaera hydrolytica TaxID=3242702 RepID=A0ABV4U224_9BACT